eukprot:5742252-Pyramimonas_sp.AAC.1
MRQPRGLRAGAPTTEPTDPSAAVRRRGCRTSWSGGACGGGRRASSGSRRRRRAGRDRAPG